jgi:hypothetical protein
MGCPFQEQLRAGQIAVAKIDVLERKSQADAPRARK